MTIFAFHPHYLIIPLLPAQVQSEGEGLLSRTYFHKKENLQFTCSHVLRQSVGAGLSLYSVDAAAIDLSKPKGRGRASKAARSGMLFTHRGFSGPAMLDLSHHAVMAIERSTPKPGVPRVSVLYTGSALVHLCLVHASFCQLQMPFACCPLPASAAFGTLPIAGFCCLSHLAALLSI